MFSYHKYTNNKLKKQIIIAHSNETQDIILDIEVRYEDAINEKIKDLFGIG
jgi:hypothetical protein